MGLLNPRKSLLPMPGCKPAALILRSGLHVGMVPPRPDLDMVAPAASCHGRPVYIHDDLIGAEFEPGDLHLVACV